MCEAVWWGGGGNFTLTLRRVKKSIRKGDVRKWERKGSERNERREYKGEAGEKEEKEKGGGVLACLLCLNWRGRISVVKAIQLT